MILRHPSIAHALRPLGEDPFIRRPQIAVPPIAIPVFGLHVVALNRREVTVPLGRRLTSRSGTIALIRIDRALRRTDMPQALRIRQIGGRGGHFIDEPRLHVDTDMFLIAVPIFPCICT